MATNGGGRGVSTASRIKSYHLHCARHTYRHVGRVHMKDTEWHTHAHKHKWKSLFSLFHYRTTCIFALRRVMRLRFFLSFLLLFSPPSSASARSVSRYRCRRQGAHRVQHFSLSLSFSSSHIHFLLAASLAATSRDHGRRVECRKNLWVRTRGPACTAYMQHVAM